MATILKTKSIYFNDVNLIQGKGVLCSRKQVPKNLYRTIISPMSSIIGASFVAEAANQGLSVCCPRTMDMIGKLTLFHLFEQKKISKNQMFFVSLSLSESEDDLERLADSDARNILFDIANGYIPQIKKHVVRVWRHIGDFDNLMVGNVTTADGINYLEKEFRDVAFGKQLFVRVGIGNGGPCSTSDETGVNRGQITELIECSEGALLVKTRIVSDGGIRKPGFACKAWAAGADYVLMGSYFANSTEAETHISGDGTYYGCASEKQNKLAGLIRHSEGKVNKVDEELKPLSKIVYQYWGGVSSSVSYCGFDSVESMIGNGVFERKENSLPPKKRV